MLHVPSTAISSLPMCFTTMHFFNGEPLSRERSHQLRLLKLSLPPGGFMGCTEGRAEALSCVS